MRCYDCYYANRINHTAEKGFWKPRIVETGKYHLECRRFPPVMVLGTRFGCGTNFPTVQPDCWCYEFKEQKEDD